MKGILIHLPIAVFTPIHVHVVNEANVGKVSQVHYNPKVAHEETKGYHVFSKCFLCVQLFPKPYHKFPS